jgi:hypothetical protein
MSMPSLKERVESLELEVATLRESVYAARANGSKDWQQTIGAFTDDEGMRQILRDAMQLRVADRKKARATKASQRKTGG